MMEVTIAVAIVAFTFANHEFSKHYGLSYAAWALAIGLLISNTVGTPAWLREGVRTEMYIKTGLVLLGGNDLAPLVEALTTLGADVRVSPTGGLPAAISGSGSSWTAKPSRVSCLVKYDTLVSLRR